MKNLKAAFLNWVKEEAKGATPSLKVRATDHGHCILEVEWGESYRYYDLASLTKIIFGVTATMWAYDLRLLDLNKQVSFYLPWAQKGVRVRDLLAHKTGYAWWAPFYKPLSKFDSDKLKRLKLRELLRDEKLQRVDKALYSDLDFLMLGFLLEEVFGQDLRSLFGALRDLWPLYDQFYFSDELTAKKQGIAPTEKCPWRKKVLRGEVHDENAWAMGGVSVHAGLFAEMKTLSQWGEALLARTLNQPSPFPISTQTVQLFTQRAIPQRQGDWALGFMLPSRTGSSAGDLMSKRSFGHTGFTGTSLWMDPVQKKTIAVLSNRVYPTRENKLFVKLRPQIHNWVWQNFEEKKC